MSHPAGRKTKSAHGLKSDKVQSIYRLTCSLVMKKAKLYPVDGQDTIYPLSEAEFLDYQRGKLKFV